MRTTIEVTSRAIRLCREDKGRITTLESYDVPEGTDPLQALEQAPLPTPLGRVRLILSHGDMLLRSMVQPPCPVERLGKIVRFELQSAGDTEPVAATWHLVAGLGSGDMRLLTMVTKRKLLTEIRSILKGLGGSLDALLHPAVGLFQSYHQLNLGEQGAGMLVDVGGSHLHLALVQDGELLFLRTLSPGMEDLVKQVAEMRTLSMADATQLVAKLGKGAPSDMHEAIKRQVGAIAGLLTANIKFAKAQLRIDQFEPKVIWLSGAGAQVHGFAEALSERMGSPVMPLNPFSGTVLSVPRERLDRIAALPSPWTVALGVAKAKTLELDATQEDRELRSLFWRTQGALRVAAIAVASLMVLAIVRQEFAIHDSFNVVRLLQGTGGDGMVPKAEEARKELRQVNQNKVNSTERLTWIDGERRPGRVAVELLAAIADQGDIKTCPVFLQSYKVSRQAGQVLVDLEGFAQGSGQSPPDVVLSHFERGLVRSYMPITAIKQLPKPIDSTKQQFHYLITICDQLAEVSLTTGKDSKDKGAAVSLALPPGVDPEGAARVAATRIHTPGEQTVTVHVVPIVLATEKEPKGKDKGNEPKDIPMSFKD